MRRLAALDEIGLAQRERHFIVASTGSGKSTLAEALLEHYQARYPDDWLFIVDHKKRFVPLPYGEDAEDDLLFPDGWRSIKFVKREGIPVRGRIITRGQEPEFRPSEALIVQSTDAAKHVFDWLYDHANVHTPSMILMDESRDFQNQYTSEKWLQHVIHEGREQGIGLVVINQEPRFITHSIWSETRIVYASRLFDERNRERLAKQISGTPLSDLIVRDQVPPHSWLYVDREHWERSQLIDLEIVEEEEGTAA